MKDVEGSLAAVVVVLPSSNLGMMLPQPLIHEVLDLLIHTYKNYYLTSQLISWQPNLIVGQVLDRPQRVVLYSNWGRICPYRMIR